MIITTFARRLLFGLTSVFTVLAVSGTALLASPAVPAFAAEGTPTPQAPARDKDRAERLEKLFQREQDWLDKQAQNLDRAHELAGRVQTRIDALKEQGKDTSALETALATFNSGIVDAQASHDAAAGILDAHVGFSANGKVTDMTQALDTVKGARQALRDCRQTLRQAVKDLLQAVRDYREANQSA